MVNVEAIFVLIYTVQCLQPDAAKITRDGSACCAGLCRAVLLCAINAELVLGQPRKPAARISLAYIVLCFAIMNKEMFVCEFDFIFLLTHDENLFADDCVTFAYGCWVAGCAALHCAGMYSER